jgi:cellulose synthase/poly-beta-1,6-N-acetylglucosamine synthase-like glycosyltransferase
MIIQILSNLREEGYLGKAYHPAVAPFFAGANVAFRRIALEEIGDFDPKCITGEDCDLCIRLSASDWELYLRRGAIVSHKNPSTLRHLVRQWYGYGRYHPYVFSKHNDCAVELYGRMRKKIDGERYTCLFYRLFPVAIVVFLTRFLLLHLVALWTLAVWFLGWATAGWIGVGLTALLATSYSWPDLKHFGPFVGFAFASIRYIADMALFIGAFVGGLSQRMLYFSATVD